ncbi:glycosyl transferase group 2 [Lactiplantibacillus plantarum]|nr:glycosyl transferase group 2 [Lactiplantibacillus plantarum]
MNIISVIIPVYNSARTVSACIQSVISQTYSNLDVIIVNDGSTDNSIDICRKFARSDKRIRILSQSNQGLSVARNNGISNALGNFLYFLDSDDLIYPQALELLIHEALLNNSDIVSSSLTTFEDENIPESFLNMQIHKVAVKFTQCSSHPFFVQQITNHACGKLFSSSLFEGVRFPPGKAYEDVATTYKLYLKAYRISFTSEGLYLYRQHDGTITSGISIKNVTDLVNACKGAMKDLQYGKVYTPDHLFYVATLLFTVYTRLSKIDTNSTEKKEYLLFVKSEFKFVFQHIKLLKYTDSPFFLKLCLYRAHLMGTLLFIRKGVNDGHGSRTN